MSDYVPAFDAFRAGWASARQRLGLGVDHKAIQEDWEEFSGLPKVAPVDDELGPDVKRWALDGPVERRELIRLHDQVIERLKEVEGEHAVIRDRQTDDGELLGSLLQQVNRLGKLQGDAQRHAELGRRVAYLEQQIGKEGHAPGELMDRVITLELGSGKADGPQGGLVDRVEAMASVSSVRALAQSLEQTEQQVDDLSDGLALEREEIEERVSRNEERVSRNTDALLALISRVEELGRPKEPRLMSRSEADLDELDELVDRLGKALEEAEPNEFYKLVIDVERAIPVPPGGRRSFASAVDRAEALGTTGERALILRKVADELSRQDEQWGEQNHDPFAYLAILTEEVGELAQAALQTRFGGPAGGVASMREEAIQVAAVAVAIVACLERGKWEWGGHAVREDLKGGEVKP